MEAAGDPGEVDPGVAPLRAGKGRPFLEGERVLLVDRKGRHNLVRLRSGRSYQSHSGVVSHDSLIGLTEGSEVLALTKDADRRNPAKYLALRPTLADVVLGMPRGAQVIYPKDLGSILLAADIFAGARVLESGVGSGALSMTLLRARGSRHRVRAPRGLRERRRGERGGLLAVGLGGARAGTGGEGAPCVRRRDTRCLRGDRGHLRPDRPRPARALAGGRPRRAGPRGRRHLLCLPAVDHPDRRAARRLGAQRASA